MADTGWRIHGKQQLMFGRMFEDPQIELAHFPRGCRVFAIASGGCTAITLANEGYRVTAADLNSAQIDYVAERLRGAEPRRGRIDGLLNTGARHAGLAGMSLAKRRLFCAMTNPEEQVRYWRHHLAGWRLRWKLRVLTYPLLLGRVYSKQVLSSLPPRFDRELLARLERGFATYANAENHFVRAYLLGDLSPVRFRSGDIQLVTAGAAEYLETVPPGSFDAFTLSNIFDGAGPEYSERLRKAVAHAGKPGAAVVVRQFAGPGCLDRALLWGACSVSSA